MTDALNSIAGRTITERFDIPRICGVLLPILAALVYAGWAYQCYSNQQRLSASGVDTMATVIDRWESGTRTTGGIRHKMKIQFIVGDQVYHGKQRVSPIYYSRQKSSEKVRVRYLTDNPRIHAIDPDMSGRSVGSDLIMIIMLMFIAACQIVRLVRAQSGKRVDIGVTGNG